MSEDFIVDFSKPGIRRRCMDWLNRLVGPHRVTVCKLRHRRTDPQNRYFHGPVLTYLTAHLYECTGRRWERDEVKNYLKERFGPKEPIVDPFTGELRSETLKSMAKYEVGEFIDFLDSIHAWMAMDLGLLMPDPSEYREGNDNERHAA